jgi:hypothetical protein
MNRIHRRAIGGEAPAMMEELGQALEVEFGARYQTLKARLRPEARAVLARGASIT